MRFFKTLIAALLLVAAGGSVAALATHESTVEEHPFSTVITISGTITDVDPLPHPETVTVTVTEPTPPPSPPPPQPPSPPPPPPPLPNSCTAVLEAGGSIEAFAEGLTNGSVGCLRGGIYQQSNFSWGRDYSTRTTLRSFPGEMAELVNMEVRLDGNFQRVEGLLVRDVIPTDTDGIEARGNNTEIVGNTIRTIARNGILVGSTQSNVLIERNYIRDVGNDTTHPDNRSHAVYVQGTDVQVLRNVLISESGYGIQAYQFPQNILVAGNTAMNCRPSNPACGAIELGISVRGATGLIVNNIFDGGRLYPGSYVFDNNSNARASWSFSDGGPAQPPTNTLGQPVFTDDMLHLAAGSPGVGQARLDHVYWPDFDGNLIAVGVPDVGAYER